MLLQRHASLSTRTTSGAPGLVVHRAGAAARRPARHACRVANPTREASTAEHQTSTRVPVTEAGAVAAASPVVAEAAAAGSTVASSSPLLEAQGGYVRGVRVTGTTSVPSLGGLLAKLLRQGDDVIEAATVGPGAAHQLVKAVVRANRYLQEDGPQADGLPLCAGFQVQSVQLPNERDAAAASGSAATPDAPAGGGDGADAAAAAAADGAATSSSSPGRGGKASGLRFFVRRLPAEAAAAWAQAPGEQLYVRVVASGDKRPNPGGLARALVASEEAARAAGGTAKRTVMTAVGTKSELVALRGLSVARQLLVRAEQDVIAVPRYAAVDKLRLPDGTPLNGLELCLLPVPPRPTSVRAMQSRQAGGPARGAKAAGDSSAATVAQLQEQISTLAKNQAQLIGMLKEQQLAAQQAAGGGDSA